ETPCKYRDSSMDKQIALVTIDPSDEARMRRYLDLQGIKKHEVYTRGLEEGDWLGFELYSADTGTLWERYVQRYRDWRRDKPHSHAQMKIQARIENPFYLGPQGFRTVFLFPFL